MKQHNLSDMNVLIVDDEPRARTVLRMLLEEHHKDLNIVDEAKNIPEAVKAINKYKPDLVFLDVEMPRQTGFDLFQYFDEVFFQVIFVTASRDYAIDAFKVSALDYILKPINYDELKAAIEKAQNSRKITLKEQVRVFKEHTNGNDHNKRIALSTNEQIVFVSVDDIMFLKADGAYTEFYLKDGRKEVVSKPMGEYKKLENIPYFMKTHRSFLINLKEVERYQKEDGGYIVMNSGDIVNISRYRKEAFLSAIQKI